MLYVKGTWKDTAFKATGGGWLALKDPVVGMACRGCGCVEFHRYKRWRAAGVRRGTDERGPV